MEANVEMNLKSVWKTGMVLLQRLNEPDIMSLEGGEVCDKVRLSSVKGVRGTFLLFIYLFKRHSYYFLPDTVNSWVLLSPVWVQMPTGVCVPEFL